MRKIAIALLLALCLLLVLTACKKAVLNSLRDEFPPRAEETMKENGQNTPEEELSISDEREEDPTAEEKESEQISEEKGNTENEAEENEESEETASDQMDLIDFAEQGKEKTTDGSSDIGEEVSPNDDSNKTAEPTEAEDGDSTEEIIRICDQCGVELKSGANHLSSCPYYVSFEGVDDFIRDLLITFGGVPECLTISENEFLTTYDFYVLYMTGEDVFFAMDRLFEQEKIYYQSKKNEKYICTETEEENRRYIIETYIVHNDSEALVRMQITVSPQQ